MKIPSINQIWQSFVATFKRFPLAVVFALVGTIIAIYAIENHSHDDWIMRALFTTSLATFFFTVLTLALEDSKRIFREIFMIIGIILIGYYFWLLPSGDTDWIGDKFMIRQVFLCLGSFVAIIWAPFWKEKIKNETIWEWVRQIIMNLVQTIFFGVVIFAGIAAALFALKSLFNLDIDGEIYAQVWVAIVSGFGPLHFLSNLAQNPRELSVPKPIPTFMRVLTKYILTPLAIGYFLILYTYTFKVLLTWEWPKNLLSWLVIWFSVVAVFTYFLWTPFWKEKIAKYRRIFWIGLLPQIAMLFIAIIWRIQAYSWTENRYFVVILGLWLLGISIYFLINKKATFKLIFIALTAVILISQIGPLSGYSVGERAQKARLINFLENAQILKNGEIIPTKIELDKQIRYEISDSIDYLIDRHGTDSVRDIFPEILAKLEADDKFHHYSLPQDITKELGFDFVYEWELKNKSDFIKPVSLNIRWDSPRNIAGYDWFISSVNKYNKKENTFKLDERTIRFKFNSEQNYLEIWEGENLLEKIDFAGFFKELKAENLSPAIELSSEKMSYVHDGEKVKAKIYFPYINFSEEKAEYYDLQLYLSFR